MEPTSVSVAEADRMDREMDEALAILLRAGERGLAYLERVHGAGGVTERFPFGRRFVFTLESLAGLALVEFVEPDRSFLPGGTRVHQRARLTRLGVEKAHELTTTEEAKQS